MTSKSDRFEPREESVEANDYRAYFDSSVFRVWHLAGKERVYRITKVTALTTEIVDRGVRKVKRQPRLELVTKKGTVVPLPLLLNKTNAATIAQMYGKSPADWVGKFVTLYPATTEVGGEMHDCIRVRNSIPAATQPQRPAAPVLPAAEDEDQTDPHDVMEAEYEVIQ